MNEQHYWEYEIRKATADEAWLIWLFNAELEKLEVTDDG